MPVPIGATFLQAFIDFLASLGSDKQADGVTQGLGRLETFTRASMTSCQHSHVPTNYLEQGFMVERT